MVAGASSESLCLPVTEASGYDCLIRPSRSVPCLPITFCRCPKGLVMQNVTGHRAGVCHTSCYALSHFVPLTGRKVCKKCHFSCASCHPKAHELHCKTCPGATSLFRNGDNATLASDVASGFLPATGGRCIVGCPQSFATTAQSDGSFVCLVPPPTPSPTPTRTITPSGALSPQPSTSRDTFL